MEPVVMVVDDEVSICDNLAAFLEDEGMQVYTAYSGEDALQRIGTGLPVQVCIMDLRLPGMNGAEAILKIHGRAPQVRFIVHTGSPHDSVISDLHRAGLGDIPVFRKPLEDMAALSHTVAGLCAARHPPPA
jgi:CheY-like chemotaxis protein